MSAVRRFVSQPVTVQPDPEDKTPLAPSAKSKDPFNGHDIALIIIYAIFGFSFFGLGVFAIIYGSLATLPGLPVISIFNTGVPCGAGMTSSIATVAPLSVTSPITTSVRFNGNLNPIQWSGLPLLIDALYFVLIAGLNKRAFDFFNSRRGNWARWVFMAASSAAEMFLLCLVIQYNVDFLMVVQCVVVAAIFSYAVLQEHMRYHKNSKEASLFGITSDTWKQIVTFVPWAVGFAFWVAVWTPVIYTYYARTSTHNDYATVLLFITFGLYVVVWFVLGLQVGEVGMFAYPDDPRVVVPIGGNTEQALTTYNQKCNEVYYFTEYLYTSLIGAGKLAFNLCLIVGYINAYKGSYC
jgi:hypothetical protein